MNITLTEEEVRTAIISYLENLHVIVPADKPFVVEVDSQGRVCARIEGAQLIFDTGPKMPPATVDTAEAEEVYEDLGEFSGPEGSLGTAIDKQRSNWGLSTSSTSLTALGKRNPADYLDEIGEPSPIGRY